MNGLMQSRKANAGALLVGLGTLFIVAILFLVLTPAFNTLTSGGLDTSNFSTEQLQVMTTYQNVWVLWPAVTLIGVIFFVFVWTFKGDTFGGIR